VQSLLKPVQDEEERLKMIAGDLLPSAAVNPTEVVAEAQDVEVQSEAEKQAATTQELKEK